MPNSTEVVYRDPKQHETVTYEKLFSYNQLYDYVEKSWGHQAALQWVRGVRHEAS
jgi:hypothetical protein